MAQNEYEEKRSFSRMQVKTPVSFTIPSQPGKRFHGLSHDLSATGLMMETEVALSIDDELDILMNTGNHRLPPFSAKGVVRRVEQRDGKYLVSIELSQTN